MRRLLSVFIALCLVLSLFSGAFTPVPKARALTDGDYTYVLNGTVPETATITGYTGAAVALMMPGLLGGYLVTGIGASAFSGKTALNSVIIPNCVTSIGINAFYNCTSLASVTIGSGVASIPNYAFYNCTSLASVTIPNSVTRIGNWAFDTCSALTSVTIGSGVTGIGNNAFDSCTHLTGVTIPNSVTIIGSSAFYGCIAVTSVTIGSGVTGIGSSAFYGCLALTNLTIGSSVTTIWAGAFMSCTALTNVSIPNSVTTIGSQAFEGCSGLATLTIPNSVISIGNRAFYTCSALTNVTIGSGVTSIDNDAFNCCPLLTAAYFLGNAPTTVGISIFGLPVPTFTVWYISGKPGWTSPTWQGYQTNTMFTLTYTAGLHGTISGTTPQTVCRGASGTAVTAVADTGYHFVQWSDTHTTNPRTDTIVRTHISVTASFAINTYTLTYTPGANGTISGTLSQTVNHGASGTLVTATPNTGCHFVKWSDNNSTTAARTDTNVTANISTTATFAINTYSLKYKPGANGTVEGALSQTVNYGTDGTEVTAVPDKAYHFVEWDDNHSTTAERTDTNVTANVSAIATFAINTYTLTYEAGVHGTILGDAHQVVEHGANGAQVTAVGGTGYHFVQWSDGVLTAARTDTGVTADVSVTATFAINTYTLTYTPGAHGTITGTLSQTVNHGASGTQVTAISGTGYHFVEWTDNHSTTAARTDTGVTANITTTATFAINTYTLTYTPGAHGTITGTLSQTVNHGASGTAVTATGNPGYHFVQWSDLSTANPRTDTNVTANIAVTATFAANIGTITIVAGANGSVVPTTPVSQTYGALGTTITATASPGYHFVSWSATSNPPYISIANASVASTTVTTTTSMPQGGTATVTATFAINTYTLTTTASPSAGGTIARSPDQSSYPSGTIVTLTATTNPGYTFTGWTGATPVSGHPDQATVTMDTDKTVTATFTVNTYTVTFDSQDGSTISSQTVPYGGLVTRPADPAKTGSAFGGWYKESGCTTAWVFATDTIATATTLYAKWTAGTYTLTTTTSPSAGGSISRSPNAASYAPGTLVTLTATANPGYTFIGWSGDLTGSTNPTTVTMDGNKTVIATFTALPTYTLTTTASPSLSGTVERSLSQPSYISGTVVTLTANANPGYHFVNWSGDVTGTTSPTTVTMTGSKSVTAVFAADSSLSLSLSAGWNLVSCPVALPVSSIPALQAVYGYHDGWSVPTTLAPGEAYWLQVQNAVTVPLAGTPSTVPVPITYQAGWQLVGNPFDVPLLISNITNHGYITTCYSYDPQSGWGILDPATDSLQPGKGYWIYLSSPTTLTLTHP